VLDSADDDAPHVTRLRLRHVIAEIGHRIGNENLAPFRCLRLRLAPS